MNKFYKPKGDIVLLPIEVINKMLERQVEQGNKEDVTVFEQYLKSSNIDGGFSWITSPEGHEFWRLVLTERDYDLFFKKYPKEPKSSYPKVMLVSNSSIDGCNKGDVKRVVFMEKNGGFIAWYMAETFEEAEETLATSYWRYAIDVPAVPTKKTQLLKEADELIKKAEELKKTAASL